MAFYRTHLPRHHFGYRQVRESTSRRQTRRPLAASRGHDRAQALHLEGARTFARKTTVCLTGRHSRADLPTPFIRCCRPCYPVVSPGASVHGVSLGSTMVEAFVAVMERAVVLLGTMVHAGIGSPGADGRRSVCRLWRHLRRRMVHGLLVGPPIPLLHYVYGTISNRAGLLNMGPQVDGQAHRFCHRQPGGGSLHHFRDMSLW